MDPRRAAVVLALGLLLAGCAKPSAPGGTSPAGSPAGAGVAELAVRQANLTLATPRSDGWFNGSLAASDYRLCAVTCLAGGKDANLSPLLVKGAWARINATLAWRDPAEDASWGAVQGHILLLQISLGDDEVITYRESHAAGQMRVEAVLLRTGDQPVVAAAVRNFQGSGAATDYSLHVEVAPVTFAPFAPLALHADPSAATLVARTAQGGGTLRVWDGADRLAGTFPLTAPATRIDLRNLTRGEPVLQAVGAPADLTLAVAQAAGAPPPALRPLSLLRQFGPLHDVPEQGALDWQFEVPRAPLWAGLYLQAKGNDGAGCASASAPGACYATLQGSGQIRSPAGTVVEVAWNCYFCGGQARIAGALGSGTLVAGTYAGHYEDMAAANFQVGNYQVTYVR